MRGRRAAQDYLSDAGDNLRRRPSRSAAAHSISAHRAKRSKAIGINPLDEIAGIGPTRKRGLLKHFGSAKAVSRAGVEDLQAVAGISAEMAQRIYDFFNDKG